MPVVPSSAYVTLETVNNLIRALANDMIYSQAGEIFTDNANFMLPLLNDALEWFTNEVGNHGIETFTKETTLTPLTAVPAPQSTDPATFVNIGDQGYNNGAGIVMGPQLQLPPDLLQPLFMWERQTGSTENWSPMKQMLGGLPSSTPTSRFRIWEWRTDELWMPGSVQSNDLRLRFKGSLAQFVTPEDTLYFRGATGALAYKVLSTYMGSKDPEASQTAAAEANLRVAQICTRGERGKQNVTNTRRAYGKQQGGRVWRPPINP